MPLVLKFNYELFFSDLCEELKKAADDAIQRFLNDAKSGLKSNDQEIEPAVVDFVTESIHTACIFYAQSILRSYGRGKQMDKTNEYLQEYINSSLWNPAREKKPGAQIVGRPKGNYTNILGQTVYSTGEHEGQVTAINVGTVVQPSYSIQNAEKKLKQGLSENGYVMRIFKSYAQNFISNMDSSKYFYNEEVEA